MITEKFSDRTRIIVGVLAVVLAACVGLLVRWELVVHGDNRVLAEFIESRDPVTTVVMQAITLLLNPLYATLLAVVLGLLVWRVTRSRWLGGYVVACVAGASAITHSLKLLVRRERPPLITQLTTEQDFSFPSGHSTAAAAFGVSLILVIGALVRSKRIRTVAWLLGTAFVLSIAVSRLYLGVHWFTDVASGLLVGAGTSLGLSWMVTRACVTGEAAQLQRTTSM
ncbi:phosphatase PAP2 family protein [Corynebacterium sp.]|uniref:phosphatase PAP2 family protein n=1 Tax=Corynebacterium sp. TaxID=1720 RepID=UPI0026DD2489|nr:phosphatase PAP2 family protein [Corynebacterium sp.]MDO5075755.1 phosphatase PAP2 family protein [Corynebacterium sp.]